MPVVPRALPELESDFLPEGVEPMPVAPQALPEHDAQVARATSPQGPAVKARYEVTYGPGEAPIFAGGPRPAKASDLSGVDPIYHDAARYLQGLADDPNNSGFKVQILRRRPAAYQGYRLAVGPVLDELDPMPIQDVKNAVTEVHGGGSYAVRVITPAGALARQMMLHVDEVLHAPRIPPGAVPISVGGQEGLPGAMHGGPRVGYPASGGAPSYAQMVAPEIVSLRNEEQKTLAEVSLAKARRSRDEALQEIEDQKEEARVRKEKKEMFPQIEMQQAMSSVRDEFRSALDGMRELVRTIAESKKDDGSLPLIMESIKASNAAAQKSTDSVMSVLTALIQAQAQAQNKPSGGNVELIEAMKLATAANEKVMAMAMQGQSRGEKLVETVLLNKLQAPQDQLKVAMDFMNQGRTQAMDMLNVMRDFQDAGASEEVIEPGAGFMGNLGNVVLHGIRRAADGFARSGSGRVADVLQALAGGGGGAGAVPQQQYSPAPTYEPTPQPELAQGYAEPRYLPAPQQQQPQPQPVPRPELARGGSGVLPLNASYFEGVVDDGDGDSGVGDTPVGMRPAEAAESTATAPAVEVPGAAVEWDLREHVEQAMLMAIDDFKAGRKVHDWPEYAVDKWNRAFKISLAQAPDDAARIRMLAAVCSPQTWDEIRGRLMAGGQDVLFFTQGLAQVVADVAGVGGVRVA